MKFDIHITLYFEFLLIFFYSKIWHSPCRTTWQLTRGYLKQLQFIWRTKPCIFLLFPDVLIPLLCRSFPILSYCYIDYSLASSKSDFDESYDTWHFVIPRSRSIAGVIWQAFKSFREFSFNNSLLVSSLVSYIYCLFCSVDFGLQHQT